MSDLYFTVGFDLGKVVVFEDGDGRVLGVVFDLEGRFEERPAPSPVAAKFAGYLEGKGNELVSVDIDLSRESAFRQRVYKRVREIPYGQTATYGEVAADVGRPGGARAVGQAMADNRYPLIIPCHRVVSGGGNPGGFSSGVALKKYLLKLEGHYY